MGPGYITRGILVDMPLLKKVKWLAPSTPIYAEDLEAWEAFAKIKIGPGDALLSGLGKPVPLFGLRVTGPTGAVEQCALSGNAGAAYDILPEGRFVMVRGADPIGAREIVVVQRWFEELKRLVPAN